MSLLPCRMQGGWRDRIKHFYFFYSGINTWVLNKGTPLSQLIAAAAAFDSLME